MLPKCNLCREEVVSIHIEFETHLSRRPAVIKAKILNWTDCTLSIQAAVWFHIDFPASESKLTLMDFLFRPRGNKAENVKRCEYV